MSADVFFTLPLTKITIAFSGRYTGLYLYNKVTAYYWTASIAERNFLCNGLAYPSLLLFPTHHLIFVASFKKKESQEGPASDPGIVHSCVPRWEVC